MTIDYGDVTATCVIAFHSKYIPVFHSFWDKVRYWSKNSKIAIFNLPHLHLAPVGHQKTRGPIAKGYSLALFNVSHRRTRHVTQLFTYVLTHKLFSSCIRRYLVSRACDWVMPALSALFLILIFQFSLLFFHISVGSQAAAAAYVVYPILDIGRCRKCGTYVTCMRRIAQGKDWIDSNGINWH